MLKAIDKRISRRSYTVQPLDETVLQKLNSLIEVYNTEGGLHIQLIQNNAEAFGGLTKSYGLFSGVRNFFALVASKNTPDYLEKLGYYGELLVLEATNLGLGTCFVGGTFSKKDCHCTVGEHEDFSAVITVGYTMEKPDFKEKMLSGLTHRKTKTVEQMYTADSTVPKWFLDGMKAVQKAPSAMNGQPVTVLYKDGTVSATVPNKYPFQLIDLGIAKANFALVAGGRWQFGNGANFTKE